MSTSRRRFLAATVSLAAGAAMRAGGAEPEPAAIAKMPASPPDADFMPPVIPAKTPQGNPNPPLTKGKLGPGTIHTIADIPPNGVLSGAGMGMTIIDAFGLRPAYRKAVVVIEGPGGGTVEKLTVRGAAIDDADGRNASGVCNGQLGFAMTIDSVEIYGCQEGIRSLGGNVAIKNCYVHHNGSDSPNGNTHNLYLNDSSGVAGSDKSVVTVTNSKFEKAILAHEFKSRLGFHVVSGCTFASLVIPGSQGNYATGPTTQLGGNGSCVDLPNGSDWKGKHNIYIKGSGALDMNFITFGLEGLYPNYSAHYHEDSPTFDNQTGKECFIVAGGGCTVTLNNPTFKGGRPTFKGHVVVTGKVTET
ncbi:MAG TPA: hypothetical protein VKZ79_22425 [Alphaproteobacteria bacterium]|nr:hypothetical protein [Alphaproteobacteria bacterium]